MAVFAEMPPRFLPPNSPRPTFASPVPGGGNPAVSAFTLIELMVVVALIGIMTAMIIPEMRGSFGDALLRSSGRDLVNVCGIANSRAVSFNQLHRVHLDSVKGRFQLEKRVRSSTPEGDYRPVRDVPGGQGEIDSRITVHIKKGAGDRPEGAESETSVESSDEGRDRGGDESLSFYPDGTADRAEIMLRDREGFGLILRVNPITARIQIVPIKRE